VPVYKFKSTTLLLFDSLDQANDSLTSIIGHAPAAIELMDRTSLAALDGEGLLPKEVMGQDFRAVCGGLGRV